MKQVYTVFIKDGFSALVPSGDDKGYWAKVDNGWTEVWDSAPSEIAGFEYAREHENAVPVGTKVCCRCHREMRRTTPAIGLAKGKLYYYHEERWRPFKGWVCGMHADEIENRTWVK